jgi:hypothetical protein
LKVNKTPHFRVGIGPFPEAKKVKAYVVWADSQRHTNLRVALPVRLD